MTSFISARFVLCRSCGRDVADPSYLLTLTSTLSPFDARQQNLTSLFGSTSVPLQSLTNPHGHTFDVVLFQKAGCLAQGPWVAEDTWFPGYAWRICVCGACGRHLGWMYEPLDEIELSPSEPSEQGFYGLILTKLIDEECTFIIKDILGLLTS